MVEKCLLAASNISGEEIMNSGTVADAINQMSNLKVSRLLVTDQNSVIIYDSAPEPAVGSCALLPEVIQALSLNDVFTWDYHDGVMISRVATPVLSYGTLAGCVYMMEIDAEQGLLVRSLQRNVLLITLILEVAVLVFSIIFYGSFSLRLKRILASMRIIRGGDYTHKVKIGGRDELTLLGDEFNELTTRLYSSEGKRRQFVSDASHELKTPLASIKLLSDSILQNAMDMETVKEFVGDIGNEADRLNRMSSKLLSLSKIETQENSDCEIVYIAPTVARVTKMLSVIAKEGNIRIIHDFRRDSPILIMEDDLYQIIFNLVENGIKYNVDGGTLTLSLTRDGDNAVLSVADTGVGIPDEAQPHLFERFFRVDKARSRKSGGSGLGLSIVKSMVERNNGTISVTSVPEKGSVFTVQFPIFDTEAEE